MTAYQRFCLRAAWTSLFCVVLTLKLLLMPLQVGAWIAKAKMGLEANNFHALGMPSTLHRLVNGTIVSGVMGLCHPSWNLQTVMSMFKKLALRQSKVFLTVKASCVLLADLSKALERVSPGFWHCLEVSACMGHPALLVLYHMKGNSLRKFKGNYLSSCSVRQTSFTVSTVFLMCCRYKLMWIILRRRCIDHAVDTADDKSPSTKGVPKFHPRQAQPRPQTWQSAVRKFGHWQAQQRPWTLQNGLEGNTLDWRFFFVWMLLG